MEKMNKLFLDEYLEMKYKRFYDEDEKRKKEKEALKEYVTEIERRELINRKVFELKSKLIYEDQNFKLDFNYQKK